MDTTPPHPMLASFSGTLASCEGTEALARVIASERLMTMVSDDGQVEVRVPVTLAAATPSSDGLSLDVDMEIDRTRCEIRHKQDDGAWGPWEHLDVPAERVTPGKA